MYPSRCAWHCTLMLASPPTRQPSARWPFTPLSRMTVCSRLASRDWHVVTLPTASSLNSMPTYAPITANGHDASSGTATTARHANQRCHRPSLRCSPTRTSATCAWPTTQPSSSPSHVPSTRLSCVTSMPYTATITPLCSHCLSQPLQPLSRASTYASHGRVSTTPSNPRLAPQNTSYTTLWMLAILTTVR